MARRALKIDVPAVKLTRPHAHDIRFAWLVHNMTQTLALRCDTVRRHAVRYPAFLAVA